jgi:hypothetical protein
MKGLVLMVSTIFLVAGTQIILNLQPEAEITVEALSHFELEELGWTTAPSTGLKVVGVGELVYLSGSDAEGEDVTSYVWSITPAPTSTATLDSAGTMWNTFRPDVQGDYTVNLTVTTASGSSDASVVITAATYTGIEAGQCGTCHFNTKNTWAETGHATKLTRAIDGIDHSFYAERCIECHSVGYNTDPTAVNGGFDDVQAQVGWTFPDTLQSGNWADMVANYPDLAAKANIQCENCHGPASQHSPFNPDGNNRLGVSLDEGVCGRCHEEEPYHLRNIQWKESAHATGGSFARGGSQTCSPCHSGWGYIDRFQDKSTGGKYWTSELPPQNITCAVCHDPHMSKEEGDHQLRTLADIELENGYVIATGGKGKLCMSCHRDRRDGGAEVYVLSPRSTFRGPHGNVQADMLFGQNYISYGRVLPNSTHKDVTPDACVTCHMSETPADGELGHNKLGDHSWSMHAEEIVGTDTVEVYNVSACRNCHIPDMNSFDDIMARADHDGDGTIEPAQAEVEGLLHDVGMMLPPFGEPEVDIRDPLWNTEEGLFYRRAAWNYLYVEEDQSHGIHNYQLTVALLQLTKKVLEFGVLDAGVIMGIEDVPNDQGRQVGVAWSRFGGDGPSDTPIDDYYVWRAAESGGSAKATYQSFSEVPVVTEDSEVDLGSMSVMLDGHLWTAVGHQPAAAFPMYSAVVPTLGDATATDTLWSTFVVSGHVAGAPDMTIITEPMMGYSVDNLVPTAPMMSAAGSKRKVELVFELDREEYRNADFDYFAIYRSTESGFDPVGMEPFATTAEDVYDDTEVTYNNTYYYRAAAFDFSGNQGEFSDEVMGAVGVGVDGTGEIPIAFELYQNYPNPFNPSTTIAFDVPQTSDVSVAVFDLLGRQVRTLVNGSLPAGKHTVTLNAQSMSSGLYVVRFDTPDGAFERTILLIK